MEKRTIKIGNTKTQQAYKIQSDATTLGELKTQLTLMGIDFANMSFTEGLTRTTLLSNDSLLPTNIMHKGQVTNDLVILLTNTEKNVASGATSRAGVYAQVKELGLQDAVKEHFGRNFTQVPTADLIEFIDADTCHHCSDADEGCFDEEFCDCDMEEEECENTEPAKCNCDKEADNKEFVNFVYDAIKFLVNARTLDNNDLEVLADLISELAKRVKETKISFSDSDIQEALTALDL